MHYFFISSSVQGGTREASKMSAKKNISEKWVRVNKRFTKHKYE